jgi:hypothetical protein
MLGLVLNQLWHLNQLLKNIKSCSHVDLRRKLSVADKIVMLITPVEAAKFRETGDLLAGNAVSNDN